MSRERDVVQGAGAPGRDLSVELRADPVDLALAERGAAHRDDPVIDPARADTFDVGLHHHGVQRHVDPPGLWAVDTESDLEEGVSAVVTAPATAEFLLEVDQGTGVPLP